MKSIDIQPILDEPILFIDSKKILIIADLHIGIEKELREYGLNAPSQTRNMTDHLILICTQHKMPQLLPEKVRRNQTSV